MLQTRTNVLSEISSSKRDVSVGEWVSKWGYAYHLVRLLDTVGWKCWGGERESEASILDLGQGRTDL